MTSLAMDASSPSARTSREVLTVDLRGMRAALLERARVRGVSASVILREALVNSGLGSAAPPDTAGAPFNEEPLEARVRVSLRLSLSHAQALASAASAAGRSLGGYVVDLMRSPSDVMSADERRASTAALVRSNAELATLSRNVAHLSELLGHGQARAAQEYRETLERLNADVQAHLTNAAKVLAAQSGFRG